MATVEFSPIVEQDYPAPQLETGETIQREKIRPSEIAQPVTIRSRERAHTAAVMDTDVRS